MHLRVLELSNNLIETISGVRTLTNLSNLNISGNRIRTLDQSAMEELSSCVNLSSFDISNNNTSSTTCSDSVSESDPIMFFTKACPNVRCLYTHGNPIQIPPSRDLHEKFPNLVYLNARPFRRAVATRTNYIDLDRAEGVTRRRQTALSRIAEKGYVFELEPEEDRTLFHNILQDVRERYSIETTESRTDSTTADSSNEADLA